MAVKFKSRGYHLKVANIDSHNTVHIRVPFTLEMIQATMIIHLDAACSECSKTSKDWFVDEDCVARALFDLHFSVQYGDCRHSAPYTMELLRTNG